MVAYFYLYSATLTEEYFLDPMSRKPILHIFCYLICFDTLLERFPFFPAFKMESLLSWSELKYVFIGFASMDLRFEVSIQGLFFGVSMNHHAFIVFILINHHFKKPA